MTSRIYMNMYCQSSTNRTTYVITANGDMHLLTIAKKKLCSPCYLKYSYMYTSLCRLHCIHSEWLMLFANWDVLEEWYTLAWLQHVHFVTIPSLCHLANIVAFWGLVHRLALLSMPLFWYVTWVMLFLLVIIKWLFFLIKEYLVSLIIFRQRTGAAVNSQCTFPEKNFFLCIYIIKNWA